MAAATRVVLALNTIGLASSDRLGLSPSPTPARLGASLGRRALVASVAALAGAAGGGGQRAARADVIGDLLRPCERVACVSSQDDRPAVWDNPWEYDERQTAALPGRLRAALEAEPGCNVVEATGRYLRATVNVTADGSVRDELEFYLTRTWPALEVSGCAPGCVPLTCCPFPPSPRRALATAPLRATAANDVLVQFRAERAPGGVPDLGANRRRVEALRKKLGLSKLPVLRTRRTLLWFESPLDSFGPATYDVGGMPPLGR